MSNKTYNAIVKTVNYNASAAKRGGMHIPFAQFAEPIEVATEDGEEFTKRTAVIDNSLAKWISVNDVALVAKAMGFGIADAMAEIESQKTKAEADARKAFSGKEVVVEERTDDDNNTTFVIVGFASDAATATTATTRRSTRKSSK